MTGELNILGLTGEGSRRLLDVGWGPNGQLDCTCTLLVAAVDILCDSEKMNAALGRIQRERITPYPEIGPFGRGEPSCCICLRQGRMVSGLRRLLGVGFLARVSGKPHREFVWGLNWISVCFSAEEYRIFGIDGTDRSHAVFSVSFDSSDSYS